MTTQEFSNGFDTLLNSYNTSALYGEQTSQREIVLDEYEKSFYLTKAQEEVVINLYNGKNPYNDSFESSEELRRSLNSLVKTYVYTSSNVTIEGEDEDDTHLLMKVFDDSADFSKNSVLAELPDDLLFITLERVILSDSKLKCPSIIHTASVYPVTQDEYSKIINNPFRGATKYKVLRLDTGANKVELISNYNISKYLIKYLSKPTPIVLTNLEDISINGEKEVTECKLPSILHNTILDAAVRLAVQSKSIGATNK